MRFKNMKKMSNEVFLGTVLETLPNTMFRIELENKNVVLATVAGRLRRRFIRLLPGDRVRVEITPYDLARGRIIWKEG